MIREPHDDLLSLVRRALPEGDDDSCSPRGSQARAVFERVLSSSRLAVIAGDDGSPALGSGTDGKRRRAERGSDHGTPSMPRRWRLAVPTGIAAVVVAVLAGLGTFSTAPVVLNAKTVAYRTLGSVTDVTTTDVAYAQSVVTNASGAVTGTYDSWTYQGQGRVEQLNADGTPMTDSSWPGANGSVTGRVVNYLNQTWQETSSASHSPFGSGSFGFQLNLATLISRQLSLGQPANVQTTTLDGRSALELSGTVEFYHPVKQVDATGNTGAAGNSGPAGNSGTAPSAASSKAARAAAGVADGTIVLRGTKIGWTLWVDPATYLPMQMTETLANGTTATSSISWLAPSSPNLGQLVAPIPAGFTEVGSSITPTPAGNTGS